MHETFAWQIHRDPNYCPYCMRCQGFQRMYKVENLYWRCPVCPGIHDVREYAAEHEAELKRLQEVK